MTPEEFRDAGHRLIDWIAEYRQQIDTMPVKAQVNPDEVRNQFPASVPETPIGIEQLLNELETIVVPGITQVQHPMHFGWFPSNASLASVLGDIASSGLGTLGISWESCPALTEVETVVCAWLQQLTGLSEQWHGSIQDTASTACLTALLVAREQVSNYSQNRGGLQAESAPLRVYATAEAHSSIAKSVLLAGFGATNLRLIDVDPRTRAMSVGALEQAIAMDIKQGACPAAIVATVGTTGVTAMDPIDAIARVAKTYAIWLHIDAAMAGSAMLLPECRHLWDGVEHADSIAWNPHKWMGTVLDCALFYVKDTEALIRVMSTNPAYLHSPVDGQVTQYRDWGIPLGRRFRALKLWFHLRLDGPEAIRQRLRRDLEQAQWLAKTIEKAEHWQLMAPVNLQVVCIRHQPPSVAPTALDAHTLNWVQRMNQSGAAFMSTAKLDGCWIARVSIGVESTTHAHVLRLWELIQAAALESVALVAKKTGQS